MPAPRPLITELARPFWNALRAHRVMLQQCDRCSHWIFYPRPMCPLCGARELSWRDVPPGARLYSYTITDVPVSRDFADIPRQILAIVELSVGVRVPSTLVNVAPERVQIGAELEPVFDDTTFPDLTVLRFAPC
ncbi:MAG: zinc ribbon domain-containing protein [Steroidobacteraceae bacterium]